MDGRFQVLRERCRHDGRFVSVSPGGDNPAIVASAQAANRLPEALCFVRNSRSLSQNGAHI